MCFILISCQSANFVNCGPEKLASGTGHVIRLLSKRKYSHLPHGQFETVEKYLYGSHRKAAAKAWIQNLQRSCNKQRKIGGSDQEWE